MKYLHRTRNLACVVFVFVMIAAWPAVTRADPEGYYCIQAPPYLGMWWHDHGFTEGQCASAEETCDAWCEYCYGYGYSCAYVNTCGEGYGVSGACGY
jgi:hypothetical protein